MIKIADINALAIDRWHDIFSACGMDVRHDKRHSACPVCGGKDRFRCDNKGGNGTWICNHCGAGDGIELVKNYLGDIKQAVEFCGAFLGIRDNDIDMRKIEAKREQAAIQSAKRKAAEAEQKVEMNLTAAGGARMLLDHAEPADFFDNAYYYKKMIEPHSTLFMRDGFYIPVSDGRQKNISGSILVPMINHQRQLVNCQIIGTKGFKMFLLGGQVIGAFSLIGMVHNQQEIMIGEGFATMATIREVTELPCVVAFNAGNLDAVCQVINFLYPDSVKTICADNDHHLNGTKAGNIGMIKAAIAAHKHGMRMVHPPALRGVSDFNDLALIHGKGEVLKCLN